MFFRQFPQIYSDVFGFSLPERFKKSLLRGIFRRCFRCGKSFSVSFDSGDSGDTGYSGSGQTGKIGSTSCHQSPSFVVRVVQPTSVAIIIRQNHHQSTSFAIIIRISRVVAMITQSCHQSTSFDFIIHHSRQIITRHHSTSFDVIRHHSTVVIN